MVAYDLKFGQITQFMLYMEGKYNLQVFPSGNVEDPFLTQDFSIDKNSVYTMALAGEFIKIELFRINEKKYDGDIANDAIIDFTNFIKMEKNLDLHSLNNDILFRDVAYGKTTENKKVASSDERFSVSITGDDGKLAESEDIKLIPITYYNIFCIGSIKKVELIIIPGGQNYLDVC